MTRDKQNSEKKTQPRDIPTSRIEEKGFLKQNIDRLKHICTSN